MCVSVFLIRIYYLNGTQEIIFNATIEQFFKKTAAADVALVEYSQDGKVKFSAGKINIDINLPGGILNLSVDSKKD